MNRLQVFASGIAIVAAASVSGDARSQPITMKFTCQNIGGPSVEPFGTEPGHSLRVNSYSCSVSGGPLDGGVTTNTNYWEARGQDYTLLTGNGVIRSPKGISIVQAQEGSLKVEMKDGKAAGWNASGRSRYIAGSGAASALNGKTYRWNAHSTGPASFTIETTVE